MNCCLNPNEGNRESKEGCKREEERKGKNKKGSEPGSPLELSSILSNSSSWTFSPLALETHTQ